ncbi:MAG: Zn-dependent alcohol dehydrogenase [Kiloniellales bacterium]|jgi:S-(hydroxymethyl)glutathione dehydrogenase/alcohol dehydrogenase|nr:Zn-dependent alcohol dehydrogenase [Kiloniellales bacterium]
MKAAVCYEFGKPLVIEEVSLDPPQAGEVKVKLAACAICHSDIHYAEGAWGGRLPAVYGHEAAGVVEEVGPGVSLAAPGDHVVVTLIRSCGECFFCAQGDPHVCETVFRLDKNDCFHGAEGQRIKQGLRTGAFAESVVVEESQVVPIPKEVPLDSASLLACGVITGLGAVVNTAKVPPGSSVAVIGTGGVGLNSVQGAALCGAQPIVALDLADAKLEAARAFGATDCVNPASEDPVEAVKALTGGRGADYVFVTVGSVTAIEQGFALLRNAGTLVIVGMPAAGAMAQFEPLEFADRGQRILGSKMGSTRLRVDVPRLVAHYQKGRLKLDELITERYPLERINEAIASVNRGEALRNVIVF